MIIWRGVLLWATQASAHSHTATRFSLSCRSRASVAFRVAVANLALQVDCAALVRLIARAVAAIGALVVRWPAQTPRSEPRSSERTQQPWSTSEACLAHFAQAQPSPTLFEARQAAHSRISKNQCYNAELLLPVP